MRNKLVFKAMVVFAITLAAIYGLGSYANPAKPLTPSDTTSENELVRYYVKYHEGTGSQALELLRERQILVVDHMPKRRVILVSSDMKHMGKIAAHSFIDYVEEAPERERYSQ